MELILGRLLIGKWPHLASAYISGISVGILIRSPCLALRTVQPDLDHVEVRDPRARPAPLEPVELRHRRHAAPGAVGKRRRLSVQWGNKIWPMIVVWTLGSVIIWRSAGFTSLFTYVVSFFVFSSSGVCSRDTPWLAEAAPITGPMYQLFVFFMITDPKTTVRTHVGQCSSASWSPWPR